MPGPFPGMEPYLEDPTFWEDFHHRFLTYWRDALNDRLPQTYEARIKERVTVIDEDEHLRRLIIPDVTVLSDPRTTVSSMTQDLHEMADEVSDEESFLRFVFALANDWNEEVERESKAPSSPDGFINRGWENGTIGYFLEAAARWGTTSIQGLALYEKPQNPWTRMAQILHAGKFYE